MANLDIVKSEIGNLLGLDGHNDPAETNGEYAPFLTGFNLRGQRIYPINKFANQGSDYKFTHRVFYPQMFDDFFGSSIDGYKWFALAGSAAVTGQKPTVGTTQAGGVAILTTGTSGTHTMAVNGTELVGSRSFLVSNGATRFETAFGNVSATTSQAYNMGLTDSTSLQMAFTISGTTVTANATNAAAFVWDAAATGTNATLMAVAVNAGGTAQKAICAQVYLDQTAPAAAALAIDTAAFHKYRIDIDTAGNAFYYVDDCLVASILLAVATTAVLAPCVATFSEATSAGQTSQIDYILCEQLRLVE